MRLYNTLTRQKEEFEPLEPGAVRLYTCGPTVYNFAHIGNLRTYVFEDLLRRALEFEGYPVNHVMNITDVGHLTSDADEGEDKMKKGAAREKKTVWEIAEHYTKAFMDDMARLNLLHPTRTCKATDHIEDMVRQILKLQENGLTYTAKNGNVYFDTGKLLDYGKLAQLEKQELQPGARIEVDENKKHPHDFALWFVASKHGDQDMQWESPWGRGFPGWHIECSAMATKYLGEQFDIHCGGIDHIPVHHTNEIAQAEGALKKKPWVRFWMHGNFLVLKEVKMAKSGENFLTLQTLMDKGFDPLDYRYFCLQAHYRKELAFSWEALAGARAARRKLQEKVRSLGETQGKTDSGLLDDFIAAIEDDLNIPQALAAVWKLAENEKVKKEDRLAAILQADRVLGLKLDEPMETKISAEVTELLLARNRARATKDWKRSDELRDQIIALGFEVSDTEKGSGLKAK